MIINCVYSTSHKLFYLVGKCSCVISTILHRLHSVIFKSWLGCYSSTNQGSHPSFNILLAGNLGQLPNLSNLGFLLWNEHNDIYLLRRFILRIKWDQMCVTCSAKCLGHSKLNKSCHQPLVISHIYLISFCLTLYELLILFQNSGSLPYFSEYFPEQYHLPLRLWRTPCSQRYSETKDFWTGADL